MERTQVENTGLPFRLWIRSAKQVVQVVKDGSKMLKGAAMGRIAVLEARTTSAGTEGVGIIVDSAGRIHDLGYDTELSAKYSTHQCDLVYDATGKCILPGLIDAHTHPVWAGDRVHEFSMKLAGASYMDILNAGGGIHFTVSHTRSASEEELLSLLRERLKHMLRNGTTLAEVKSGYGLDLESELKQLRVLREASKTQPVELSITYCGAHAVPRGMTATEATQAIVDEHLPRIKQEMDAGNLQVHNVDVFCETGVFTPDQARTILVKGQEYGMMANVHAEELSYIGGTEMAASLNAAAISHLEYISDEGIAAMANSGSVAVLLPATAFVMRLPAPPARKLIESNVPVALGTDFCPNSHCLSMPLAMHMAAVMFHMSLQEVLAAGTINAAASLRMSDTHGSIEKGKFADLLVLDAPSWEHLLYQFGNGQLIAAVFKKGQLVFGNEVTNS